jgi:hypothetical protein
MKIRWNTTLISTLLLSLCLVTLIPTALQFISTWTKLYFEGDGFKEQDYLMPIGCFSLGFVMIGLIVLWTGYRKKERWAWFVMLILVLCYVFPGNVLPLLLINMQNGGVQWSYWFGLSWLGDPVGMGFALGILNFLVMLVALLLPIKTFFWGSAFARSSPKIISSDN